MAYPVEAFSSAEREHVKAHVHIDETTGSESVALVNYAGVTLAVFPFSVGKLLAVQLDLLWNYDRNRKNADYKEEGKNL